MSSPRITNFGRNLSFTPQQVFAPHSEPELLAILDECRGRRIRTSGRLHSWSEAPVADDVLLDLRHLNQVDVERRDDKVWVTVGAGCQIKRLLSELDRQSAGTLPTLGLITEQTIAGAISTATHGSGRPSMSHFAEEIRVAAYDPVTGDPVIRVIRDGPELRAARCSLGAMGVIVSVSFWAKPHYQVEEVSRRYTSIEDVLDAEADYPLQQFYLMPWLWQYFVHHRREVSKPRGGWATLYRWYFFVTIDVMLHVNLLVLIRILRSPRAIKFFYRFLAPRTVIENWTVVDKSQEMLVMEHELFRHIEIEVFVTRSDVVATLDYATALLKHFDGDAAAIDPNYREQLDALGLLTELDERCGSYTHHYPICVRRVLPDDTLISMTGGVAEPSYAISFISYAKPTQRESFMKFAELLSKSMAALFDARPHWGKVCPLTAGEATRLYPGLPEFRKICDAADRNGVFRNDWISRTLFAEESTITCDSNAVIQPESA
ncbi:MAG: D-arabinono-1,4-lactone oxidase [Pirellulales bacterium]